MVKQIAFMMTSAVPTIVFSLVGVVSLIYALTILKLWQRETRFRFGVAMGLAMGLGLAFGVMIPQAWSLAAMVSSFVTCGVGYIGVGLTVSRRTRPVAPLIFSCLGGFVLTLYVALWMTVRSRHS